LPRPDFRSQAAQRLAGERLATPALIDLLQPQTPADVREVRKIRVELIYPNPTQPRLHFDEDALAELASSIKEHGILQPVLVRPRGEGRFQLVAGERRWRAAKLAGLADVPAIVEEIDDQAALEIALIENLQREDISPLDEAAMYERMTTDHGYSIRKLAQKLGKDKGYVENRLRLADAPAEIRELVSLRKDTISHAYELLKVEDPRKRRRLAQQVASGELSLVKLRQRIEGKARATADRGYEAHIDEASVATVEPGLLAVPVDEDLAAAIGLPEGVDLDQATDHLARAVDELAAALRTDAALSQASPSQRQSFAKYLTIAKIKLENAIAVVRAGEPREAVGSPDRGE